MADTTATKILEVVVDNNKAVAAITHYNQLIEEQKKLQAELAKKYKDGEITQTAYARASVKINEEMKAYKRLASEVSKELQNNIKMDQEQVGSLRRLRAELSNVTKQYDALSEADRRSEEGLKLKAQINDITAQLKNTEQETGRFYRNVGNYANSIVEAFTRMGGSMGNLQGPMNLVKTGFTAISTTPLIAVLGALVALFQEIIKTLNSSETAINAVTTAMAPFNAITRLQQIVMQKLGEGLGFVLSKLVEWADKLGLICQAMKAEQQLVKDNIALQEQERELIQRNADSQLKISQLRAKASDKLKYSEQERIALLKQAVSEEEAVAKREMDVAKERYRVLTEQSKLAANSKEENDALAQAYANMIEAEKSYYDKTRELQGQITEATNAMNAKKKEQLRKEFEELAKLSEARVDLMKDSVEKERAMEKANHETRLAELRNRLETEENLTQKAREAINKQIEIEDQLHQKRLAELDVKAAQERLEQEKKTIALKLSSAIKNSEDEFQLKQQLLQREMEMELTNIKLTEEQKQLVRENYRKQEARLEEQHRANILAASRLEYENQIAELALQQKNTLDLELQMKQEELNALYQLEDESNAEFRARQLAAEKAVVDKKKEIANYEVKVEQTKYEAISSITGALSDVLDAFGEQNKAAAKASKILALAEIAINTGKAIAAGVAQSQAVPFPANLAAIATTVATVLANIATAVSTVKSAKFATGGYVSGPGTGTSDSIHAQLSNGESVINARSTAMFGPLLSSLNQAGGGVAFNPASGGQREGYEFLAAAVASGMEHANVRVAVDEVTRVQDRVDHIKELSTIK